MVIDPDFIDRYKNKYYGKYRGVVSEINDPEEIGRLRLKIPEVYGVSLDGTSATSGWALPVGGGSMFGGMCRLPRVNDIVWVEFEYGDPDRPIWMHGPWTLIAGNNAPLHARGRYDESDIIDRGGSDTPDTPNATKLGNTQTWQTAIGQIEFDEDDDNSRILIHHKSGTRIEILNDGTMEINTQGNRRDINRGAYKQHVAGKRKILVDGVSIEEYQSRSVTVRQDSNENIAGNVTVNAKNITENLDLVTVGESTIGTGRKELTAGSLKHNISGNSREKISGNKITTVGGKLNMTVAGLDLATLSVEPDIRITTPQPTGKIRILQGIPFFPDITDPVILSGSGATGGISIMSSAILPVPTTSYIDLSITGCNITKSVSGVPLPTSPLVKADEFYIALGLLLKAVQLALPELTVPIETFTATLAVPGVTKTASLKAS